MEWIVAAAAIAALLAGLWHWRGRWLFTTWVEKRIEDDER